MFLKVVFALLVSVIAVYAQSDPCQQPLRHQSKEERVRDASLIVEAQFHSMTKTNGTSTTADNTTRITTRVTCVLRNDIDADIGTGRNIVIVEKPGCYDNLQDVTILGDTCTILLLRRDAVTGEYRFHNINHQSAVFNAELPNLQSLKRICRYVNTTASGGGADPLAVYSDARVLAIPFVTLLVSVVLSTLVLVSSMLQALDKIGN